MVWGVILIICLYNSCFLNYILYLGQVCSVPTAGLDGSQGALGALWHLQAPWCGNGDELGCRAAESAMPNIVCKGLACHWEQAALRVIICLAVLFRVTYQVFHSYQNQLCLHLQILHKRMSKSRERCKDKSHGSCQPFGGRGGATTPHVVCLPRELLAAGARTESL